MSDETAVPCDAYCSKHPECRLHHDQPVHYFDCDRFQTYNYGLKQGKCDCTATDDVNRVLDLLTEFRMRDMSATRVIERLRSDSLPANSAGATDG